jgi:hypothetical protein
MPPHHRLIARLRSQPHPWLRRARRHSIPKSIDFGVGIETIPTTPASRIALAIGDVRANDFSAPGNSAGPPLITTTIFPFSDAAGTSAELKSS